MRTKFFETSAPPHWYVWPPPNEILRNTWGWYKAVLILKHPFYGQCHWGWGWCWTQSTGNIHRKCAFFILRLQYDTCQGRSSIVAVWPPTIRLSLLSTLEDTNPQSWANKGETNATNRKITAIIFFKLRFFLQVVAARRSVFNWALGTMDPIVFPKLFSSHKNCLSLIHNAMQVLEK